MSQENVEIVRQLFPGQEQTEHIGLPAPFIQRR
jgi:hypothetical protein